MIQRFNHVKPVFMIQLEIHQQYIRHPALRCLLLCFLQAAGRDHLATQGLQGRHQARQQRGIIIHTENTHALDIPALAQRFILQQWRHIPCRQRQRYAKNGAFIRPGADG